MNLKGNENTKERRRKEEHLHYTTLKERKREIDIRDGDNL